MIKQTKFVLERNKEGTFRIGHWSFYLSFVAINYDNEKIAKALNSLKEGDRIEIKILRRKRK